MTSEYLKKYYKSRSFVYHELASRCGSVSELLLKVQIYGQRWTKWDWIMFLSFLDYEIIDGLREKNKMQAYCQQADEKDENSMKWLLRDIFDAIDNDTALDGVFTNKTIIMNFIAWLDCGCNVRKEGIYKILAHVFKKFPKMWTMNWMFIRHRGRLKTQKRTHRLEGALPMMKTRETEYFESSASLEDFVNRYWNIEF